MKKYIYGTLLFAAAAAVAVFFFRPPETTNQPPQTVLAITFRLPGGYEFTEGAPFVLTWRTESPEGVLSVPIIDKNFKPLVSPYDLIFTPVPGSKAVIMNARLYYCHKISRMCFQDDFQTRVLLEPGTLSSPGSQKEKPGFGKAPKKGTGFSSLVIPWVWEVTPKQA